MVSLTWDKGTTYFDTSSSTSSGWYMGQGTDREEHVHEGMQTSDGGFIAIGHHPNTEIFKGRLVLHL